MSRPPAPGGRRGLLAPGELLAERFAIVQLLGKGGMGEVYEAIDRELGERVALKAIRPELASDERILERFKREIHLARQVTHPNVCRIYDLFRHRPSLAGGVTDTPGELTFLTMELLAGETLAQRLARDGPLPFDEAREIASQMAAALDAAHAAGVVHRDFKTGNVQLLPAVTTDSGTASRSGPRVKVTDFGLARTALDEAAEGTRLTLLEEMIGTPAYMAPEQVEGSRVGPAADVYAFGVVLFEMATGKLPFVGPTAISTAVKRLNEPPPSPRGLRADLDPRWEATILACLERDPQRRPPSAGEALAGLLGGQVPIRPTRWRWRGPAITAAAAALLALGVGVGRLLLPSGSDTGKARTAVAVLGFKNLAGRPDQAWLDTALVEMVRTELAAGSALRTIPSDNVSQAIRDLELRIGDSLPEEALARVRSRLGADLLVFGTYLVQGDVERGQIRLDLRLLDTRTGAETTTPATGTGPFEAAIQAGLMLRRELGVAVTDELAAESSRLLAMLPKSSAAARSYAEGLAALRRNDPQRARELLEEAVAAAPESPLVRAALAAAWSRLGYDANALAEAEAAHARSGDLPQEQKLLIEARLRTAEKNWPRAIEVLRALVDFYPDDLEYGLLLADAQIANRDANAALASVTAMRALVAPANQDPRIDLVEARAKLQLGDYARAHAATDDARAKGERLAAPAVIAEAQLIDGQVHLAESNYPAAGAAYEAARAAFERAGDRRSTARSLLQQGNLAFKLRELERARGLYEEALAGFQAVGDRHGSASAVASVAMVRDDAGEPEAAVAIYEEAIADLRAVRDLSSLAKTLGNQAIALKNIGRMAEAERNYREAIAIREQIGELSGLGYNLLNFANWQATRGELREANELLERSLAIRRKLGEPENVARTLLNLANIRRLRGDLGGAQAALEEAATIAREHQPPLVLDGMATHRANLAMVGGDFAAARTTLLAEREQAAAGGLDTTGLDLHLVEAELELGRLDEAVSRLADVARRIHGSGQRDREAAIQVLGTRLAIARSDLGRARTDLAAARDLERTGGTSAFLPLELAAAGAELALATGDPTALRAVRDEMVARQADAARGDFVLHGYGLEVLRLRVEDALGNPDARQMLSTRARELRAVGAIRLAEEAAAAGRGERP